MFVSLIIQYLVYWALVLIVNSALFKIRNTGTHSVPSPSLFQRIVMCLKTLKNIFHLPI